MSEYVVAVDVGTGSARAGVFDAAGHQLARVVTPFSLFQPEANHYEQVSDEIWRRLSLGEAGLQRGGCSSPPISWQ